MALFSIEIADGDVSRVLGAVAANYNRPAEIPNPDYDPSATIANPDFDPSQPAGPGNEENIPDPAQEAMIDNPETEAQFANRIIRQFLVDNVKAFEVSEAKRQAADAASAAANPSISNPHL